MAVRNQPLKILDDYYLLPTGANIDRYDKLLGRVVKNHVYPLARYEPLDDFIPQKFVPEMMGNSNAFHSVKESSRREQSNEAWVKLSNLVGAHATVGAGQSAEVSMYTLKTYDMTQIELAFDKLKSNPQYLASITKLFEGMEHKGTGNKRLPMITRVLVCEDVEVTTTQDSNRGGGFQAAIPGTAIASHGVVPTGPLDGEVNLEHRRTVATARTQKITGGIIVGLAYTWIEQQPAQQPRKVKPKLIDRIKSWFHKKEEVPKYDIVIRDNEFGAPYMEVPGEEEVGTQTEGEGKIVEESSSDAPTIDGK